MGYVTVRDLSYVKPNSINTLYFIIDKIKGTLKKAMEINI